MIIERVSRNGNYLSCRAVEEGVVWDLSASITPRIFFLSWAIPLEIISFFYPCSKVTVTHYTVWQSYLWSLPESRPLPLLFLCRSHTRIKIKDDSTPRALSQITSASSFDLVSRQGPENIQIQLLGYAGVTWLPSFPSPWLRPMTNSGSGPGYSRLEYSALSQ